MSKVRPPDPWRADRGGTKVGLTSRQQARRRSRGDELDFREFVDELRSALTTDLPESVTPYDGLYDDLGFDSFQAFELLIVVEGIAGNVVPPAEVPELYTLGDVHAYYQELGSDGTDAAGS